MKSIEECLDIILKELEKNWNKPNNERVPLNAVELLNQFELQGNMKKHEFFKRLIRRLIKDDYAETIDDLPLEQQSELRFYESEPLITIEGYYFIKEKKGYVGQRENKEVAKKIRNERERRLSDGTVFLAIFTALLVIAEIVIHWKDIRTTLFSWFYSQ